MSQQPVSFSGRRPVFCSLCVLWLISASGIVNADVAAVAVRVPSPDGWVGQRMSVFVELRAAGSFADTASFDLPELPGTIVLKIGSPVVSTQELEGDSWFVQTHEFAVFSQKSGTVQVPEFPVRFRRRDDFVGPVQDVTASCPAFELQLKRPPGSDGIPFLITTSSLQVTETWDPPPGPVEFGAILKRTIVQTSEQIPGMALMPAPTSAADGIRVYTGDTSTQDSLQRGDFQGQRSETLTYLMQRSGEVELPEIVYVWWNPETEQLESQVLPAQKMVVAPAPVVNTPAEPPPSNPWIAITVWTLGIALAAVVVAGRKRWRQQGQALWQWLNPPERVAARALLRACHSNDAVLANHAWNQWRGSQATDYAPSPSLAEAVRHMQRTLFGPKEQPEWSGRDLMTAFRMATQQPSQEDSHSHSLPLLNPADSVCQPGG
ncbi:MAG: hypothetical protein NXI04_20065 [Planctomycetaceae bacterium]|nr:hypothetical protein [Planctomycetaceae bacterium]